MPESQTVFVDDPAMAKLLERYVARRWEDLERGKQALIAMDVGTLARIGHNMRGSGTAFGIDAISSLGAALESAAEDRNRFAIRDVLANLEALLVRIRIIEADSR